MGGIESRFCSQKSRGLVRVCVDEGIEIDGNGGVFGDRGRPGLCEWPHVTTKYLSQLTIMGYSWLQPLGGS